MVQDAVKHIFEGRGGGDSTNCTFIACSGYQFTTRLGLLECTEYHFHVKLFFTRVIRFEFSPLEEFQFGTRTNHLLYTKGVGFFYRKLVEVNLENTLGKANK